MNYRHAFHAGNFADVHKHVALLALLDRLLRKPRPILYLDTHAGRGQYDLRSADATRGEEWRQGVGRLTGFAPRNEDVRRYVQAIGSLKAAADGSPSTYPGSPLIALAALRDGDRAVLIEQQAEEARVLEHVVRRRNTSIVCGDGYAALKAYLPPKENRGLVLIDPPYEAPGEFAAVERALHFGLSRWPNGVFAVWYPVKATPEAPRMHAALKQSGLRKLLLLELSVRPPDAPLGLNGSGLIVANPPWQFADDMREAMTELHRVLAVDGDGAVRVEWLVPE